MSIKNNDRKNFIWNSIGLTLNSFNSLFFLIVVKLVNGMDIAGIFTYAFSICCLFYFLAIYYNRVYQVADYKNRFTLNQYFTARMITSISSILFLLLFSIISGFSFTKTIIIIAIMAFKMVEAISDCFYGQIQKDGKLYNVGISYAIKAIFGLVLFIIVDIVTKNLFISILTLVIVNSFILLFYDIPILKLNYKPKIKFDFSKVDNLLKITFPIFAFSFLQNYLASNQKYIMTYFLSNELQTIFGILIMPATVLNLFGSYLILPYVPKLTLMHKENKMIEMKKTVYNLLKYLLLFGLIALLGTYIFGIPVLNIVYNIRLDAYKTLLLLIIAASILNASCMIISSVLTVMNINKKQIFMFLILSLFSTILSSILIMQFKLTGAVLSYLLSYIVAIFVFIVTYIKETKRIQ